MTRVMISYRNLPKQRALATEISDMLNDNGIGTWIDHRSIPMFSTWENAIIDGITNSEFVILCLSPEYFESDICLMECYIARGYGKHIIPLVFEHEDESPDGISAIQRVFELITSHEETKGLEDLTVGRLDDNARMFGLPMSKDDVFQRILDVIHQPTSDIKYDVCISYKATQGEYATRIADDLNGDGINTFISTRSLKLGNPLRPPNWRAILQSRYHIIILTPDIRDSVYIKNEILVSRTKETIFMPILAESLVDDESARAEIIDTFTTPEFAMLKRVQWLIPENGYDAMIQTLLNYIKSNNS